MTIAPSRIMTLSWAHSWLIIKGDSDPRPHQECDGLDRGIMRLGVGIQDDVHLHAPLVGAHKRPSQPRRIQEIGVHQDGLLGAADATGGSREPHRRWG